MGSYTCAGDGRTDRQKHSSQLTPTASSNIHTRSYTRDASTGGMKGDVCSVERDSNLQPSGHDLLDPLPPLPTGVEPFSEKEVKNKKICKLNMSDVRVKYQCLALHKQTSWSKEFTFCFRSSLWLLLTEMSELSRSAEIRARYWLNVTPEKNV